MGRTAHSSLRLATSLALALAVSACASTASDQTASAEERTRPCVFVGNINGYSVIDPEHLVLQANVSDRYLITTRSRCSSLRFGVEVGLSFQSNRRLCPPIVEHITTGDGQRCQIDTIEEVESVEAARALVQSRREAAERDTDQE